MRPPTHDEVAEQAALFARTLLQVVREAAGCDGVALKVGVHAAGTVLLYEMEQVFKAHPEARGPFMDTLSRTVARLPKPPPHLCPECDEAAAEERKDRRGE